MPLTKRDLFGLRNALAQHYGSNVQQVTTPSLGDITDVSAGRNPGEYWENILRKAVKANKIGNLLQTVIEADIPNADECRDWLTEVQNGVPTRLQKLATAIHDGQCVLFLGPGTLLCSAPDPDDPDGNRLVRTTFSLAFAQALSREMDDARVYYDRTETAKTSLAYIAQCHSDVYAKLKPDIPWTPALKKARQGERAIKFYRDECEADTRLHEKLAHLPWRVVINTNPDTELANVLNRPDPGSPGPTPRCLQRYYSFSNDVPGIDGTPAPIEPLAAGQTLLYNLFGTFDDRLSMVLTESQLLDFTNRAVNKTPPLDPIVMDEFPPSDTAPKTYLFLGFDFDQWYVKIIFQTVLKLIKQKDRSFSIFPQGIDYNQFTRDFFEDEFKCYFIDYELGRLVDELLAEYRTQYPPV